MNWKDKRINEINKICSARPGAAECFIDEVHGIYESKAKSYEDFQEEQEEKKGKYERKDIKLWNQLKKATHCLNTLKV